MVRCELGRLRPTPRIRDTLLRLFPDDFLTRGRHSNIGAREERGAQDINTDSKVSLAYLRRSCEHTARSQELCFNVWALSSIFAMRPGQRIGGKRGVEGAHGAPVCGGDLNWRTLMAARDVRCIAPWCCVVARRTPLSVSVCDCTAMDPHRFWANRGSP